MNETADGIQKSLPGQAKGGGWLTARRLRIHALIVGTCLWLLYVWNVATPGLLDRNGNMKGTDFLHFYTLGSLSAAHRGADLYDMNSAADVTAQRIPQAADKRYLPLYPPQVSLLFMPLASLSYASALAVWWLCSGFLYAICCYGVWRACPNLQGHGATVFLLAIAFPAFFHLIAWGQTSALALGCFTGMYFLLRAKREFLAGIVVGCLIFKPQLGLAAAVVFVSIGAWKVVAGAILSAAAQLSIGVFYYGLGPLRQWFWMLRAVPSKWAWLEPRPYQTHSLRTFWAILVPWSHVPFWLYVISALLVLGMAIVLWRRGQSVPLALRCSSLLLATVLVAPHLTVYDLVILAPAFLLTADWILGEPAHPTVQKLSTLLYLVYVLPLLSPSVRWTHVQLSVIAMTASLYLIWRLSFHSAEPKEGKASPPLAAIRVTPN
jgi:hypothetical protein